VGSKVENLISNHGTWGEERWTRELEKGIKRARGGKKKKKKGGRRGLGAELK